MIDQWFKDWRAQVAHKAIKEPRKARKRDRLDTMMVAATILSAIATTAAVVVGVYQYGAAKEQVSAAYDQTIAADRNRTFEEVLKAFDKTCDVFETGIPINTVTSVPQSSDEIRITHVLESDVDTAYERR